MDAGPVRAAGVQARAASMTSPQPSVPTFDQLLNPMLSALHRLGGSASIPELVEAVIEESKLPREVIEQSHPGRGSQTELEYRLAWARTYLKKYGLLENSARGVWSLTPRGLETKAVDPQQVVRATRAAVAAEREKEGVPTAEDTPHGFSFQADAVWTPATSDGATVRADEAVPAPWRDRLLERLLAMAPASFERLCMRLLREAGFIQVEVTGRGGDGGIDGYGVVRLVGLLSFRVTFQCKRYRDNVGAAIVRDFRGAMIGRAEKGLIITTGGFTRDARLEATRDGATAIDLIDGELLVDKLKELGLGVTTKMVEAVEIDDDWFAAI
jgi:restriction system protein